MTPRRTILFVAENVTLSQVVRLVTLAGALDADRYRVVFACAAFPELVFDGTTFERRTIRSLEPARVQASVDSGRRLYDERLLVRQVEEDLALFQDVEPDLVVGDFRWSLTVSAPLRGVPHAALVNAYWSPHAARQDLPMPDHPMVRLLGEELAARHFGTAAPWVFRHFANPLNAVRRRYGLPEIGSLFEVLTAGDHVLYADPPELAPTIGAPPTHHYLGAVPWSPRTSLPDWWDDVPGDRPAIYVTMGSSGNATALPAVLDAIGSLPVTGLVALAGRPRPRRIPPNVFVTDYLPGDLAARRSALVVSNGGSSTGYQALAEGVPLVGVASNLDQYLAMTFIREFGAGVLVRAGRLGATKARDAITLVLESREHRQRACDAQKALQALDSRERFRHFVERTLVLDPSDTQPRPAPAARPRGFRWLSALALTAALAHAGDARSDAKPATAAPSTNEIRFSMTLDGTEGHVICALFKERGWLKAPVQVRKSAITPPSGGSRAQALCVFSGVAPGIYGISAFQDENDSGNIDTNFLGIPTEDWCASRNARGFMGPPSWGSAKFVYEGRVLRLSAAM